MRRQSIIIPLLLLCGAAQMQPRSFWEKRDGSQWSIKEARRLLSHSPWAQTVAVLLHPIAGAGNAMDLQRLQANAGGSGMHASTPQSPQMPRGSEDANLFSGSRSASITVLWFTALPVKQAFYRLNPGEPGAPVILRRQEPGYGIALAGVPENLVNAEQLARDSILRVKGKPALTPRYVIPRGKGKVTVYISFPVTGGSDAWFSQDDGAAEFITRIRGQIVIARFRLKDMATGGELRL